MNGGSLLSCAVQRSRLFLVYWLPVILWMGLIFTGSTDLGSVAHSSRILGPILHFFFPSLAPATRDGIILFVRKCGHVSEYAVLALLIWRARRARLPREARPWRWSEAGMALGLTILYAATDEFHQTFVPTREGCVRDVLIDSSGAIFGLLVLWLAGRLLNRWAEPQAG